MVFCTGYFFYMLKNKCVSLQILSEEILFGTKHNFYGYSCRTSAFLEDRIFSPGVHLECGFIFKNSPTIGMKNERAL